MMKTLLLLAVLAANLGASSVSPKETYLRRAEMDGAASVRTFTINNPAGSYAFANLEVNRTRATGTDLSITCKSTITTDAPVAVRTACTYDTSGNCTSATATIKSTTSTSEILAWRVDITGWKRTDCTAVSTAAGATDLLTITGVMVSP